MIKNEQWEAGLRRVFRCALESPKFRQLALNNPRAAFEEANGYEAPPEYKFRFVDQLDEQVLVLPTCIVGQGSLSEIDISRIIHHALRHQPVTSVK